MKTTINRAVLLLAAAFALGACAKKEIEYGVGSVDAVSALAAPSDTERVYLENTDGTVAFSWTPVASGAVEYQIVFSASADGGEVFRVVPADGATRGRAEVAMRLLDEIASLAGVATDSEGDLYWTVHTTKGPADVAASVAPRRLPVKRFAGIESPARLFVTGAATEGGTDVAAATPFREVRPGVFTAYTRLEGGQPFVFTNSDYPDGYDSYSYSTATGGYVEGGTPMTVETSGVYRVTAGIRQNSYTAELLENVHLFYPAGIETDGTTKYEFPMEYRGGGVWRLEAFRFAFTDDHYSFRVDVAGRERVWGHSDRQVGGAPSVTGGVYYYLFENFAAADNDYAYRLMPYLVGLTTDIYVDMSSTAQTPTHSFDLAQPGETPVVAALTAPADGASVDLDAESNYDVTFSWQEPTYDDAFPARYEVVFFSDAAATREIAAVRADNYGIDTRATVKRSVVDGAAAAAGVATGATGDVWWSVRSAVMDDSRMASAAARKLTVKRITLPEQVYLSGGATERSDLSAALKLRRVEDGVFEGYMGFTDNAAGFTITEGNTPSARAYTLDGGELSPATAGETIPTSGFEGISGTRTPYRITVDFKAGTVETRILRSVYLQMQGRGRNIRMEYRGDGVWSTGEWDSGSGDSRYHIRVSYTDTSPVADGNAWAEKWSCSVRDTYPDPTTGNLGTNYGGQSYYNVVVRVGRSNFYESNPNEADWDYNWKLVTGAGLPANTGAKTFTVHMNGGTGTGDTTGEITSTAAFHTY